MRPNPQQLHSSWIGRLLSLVAAICVAASMSLTVPAWAQDLNPNAPPPRQLDQAIATELFQTPSLSILDSQADQLLMKAKTCVGHNRIRLLKWYFSASKLECPNLRGEFVRLQQSVWTFLSSADLTLIKPVSPDAYFDFDKMIKHHRRNHYLGFVIDPTYFQKQITEMLASYRKTISSQGSIQISPLLAQELVRIFILTMKDGYWDPQFYYTFYCVHDPMKTCPTVSPEWKGKPSRGREIQFPNIQIFMRHGFTVRMPMIAWSKALMNSLTVLSYLPQNGWQDSFLDSSGLAEYNTTIYARMVKERVRADVVFVNEGFEPSQVGREARVWLEWEFHWARLRFLEFAGATELTAFDATRILHRYREATAAATNGVIRINCEGSRKLSASCRKTMPERADYGAPLAAGQYAAERTSAWRRDSQLPVGIFWIVGGVSRAFDPAHKKDSDTPNFSIDDDFSYAFATTRGGR